MEEIIQEFEFVVELGEESPIRVDKFLAHKFEKYSRTYLQSLLKEGMVSVDGKPVKPKFSLKGGEILALTIPEPRELEAFPQDIPLEIIYEDKDIVAVNKMPGMVVHPAPAHRDGTLVNALLFKCDNLSGINGVLRPGIVHRLDKDTSGVILVAKNDEAHRELARQFHDREVKKKYYAIVTGEVAADENTIDMPIGRDPYHPEKMCVRYDSPRNAQTFYRVLERFPGFTFLEAYPRTGRTHQIRVHLSAIGHPLLGDTIYGKSKRKDDLQGVLERFALHAGEIKFKHPITGEEKVFSAPIPADFMAALELLRQKS